MDYGRTTELELLIRHRHNDGTWSDLERRQPHDAAERDPERNWETGTLYVCKTCDEQVIVEPAPGAGGRPA